MIGLAFVANCIGIRFRFLEFPYKIKMLTNFLLFAYSALVV